MPGIRASQALYCTRHFLALGAPDLVRQRRTSAREIILEKSVVRLQTQEVLRCGNVSFERDFGLSELIALLNSKIFLWPGGLTRSNAYGDRHRDGNRWPNPPLTLRIPSRDAMNHAQNGEPQFCAFNSGSPRCSNGGKSPRGANTFTADADFPRIASAVVEVAFDSRLYLPGTSEFWSPSQKKWTKRFQAPLENWVHPCQNRLQLQQLRSNAADKIREWEWLHKNFSLLKK